MKNIRGHKQAIGALGERIACEYLTRHGFAIRATNYRKPWGEIDIIAEKDQVVRFVEVKTVSRETKGGNRPEELLHQRKIRRVVRTAEMYMNSKKDTREFQIDAVTVVLDMKRRYARCCLFEQIL